MPDIPEQLVKLAALGTSGLSIFAMFWVGYIITRKDESKNIEAHKNIRFYMCFCLSICLISVASVIWGTKPNPDSEEKHEKAIASLTNQHALALNKLNEDHAREMARYLEATQEYKVDITVDVAPISTKTTAVSAVPGPVRFADWNDGKFEDIKVRRNADGELPKVIVSLPGYSTENFSLDDGLKGLLPNKTFSLTTNGNLRIIKLIEPIKLKPLAK